jgi:hypothetical protein
MQPDNREWTDFSEYRACVASQIDASVISIEEEGELTISGSNVQLAVEASMAHLREANLNRELRTRGEGGRVKAVTF